MKKLLTLMSDSLKNCKLKRKALQGRKKNKNKEIFNLKSCLKNPLLNGLYLELL